MITIERTGVFDSSFEMFVKQYPELVFEVKQRIKWFRKNPDDTRLKNHVLTKRLKSKWAFSITGDIRIMYEWRSKTTVRFLIIGPHTDVYRKN